MNIGNLSDIKCAIDKGSWKVFGVGRSSSARNEAYFVTNDFELLCLNRTSELGSITRFFKVKVFDIEGKHNKIEKIFLNKRAITYIKSFPKKRVAIFILRASKVIKEVCKENKWALIAEENDLFKKLNNRKFFLGLLKKIGVSRQFVTFSLRQFPDRKEELFKKLGKKIVLQTPHSIGGRGTCFVKKEDDKAFDHLRDIFKKDQEIVATSFVDGFDIAITGCVTRDNGILSGLARYQFVGIKTVVSGKDYSQHSFCGNDWLIEQKYREDIQRQGEVLIQKIGKILKDRGFRGIFGIDFIYNKEKKKLIPLEINPKLPGSFPVETQFEVLNQEVPLIGFHLLEFLGIKYQVAEELRSKKNKSLVKDCSHVILTNFLRRDIEFKQELRGGVYCLRGDKIEFIRKGFWVGNIKDPKSEFILTGTPTLGSSYKKNKGLFRIIWGRSIQVDNGKDIDDRAKEVINAVKIQIKRMIRS